MRMRFRAILLCLCLGLVCLALSARAQNLPDSITQIQIDAVQVSAGQIQKVLVTELLVGKDVQQFVTRWNALKQVSKKSECSPQQMYRFSFYQNNSKLYRYAAICFDCHTIFPLNLDNPDHLGKEILFQDNDASRQLRKNLAELLPGYDPGSNKP